MNLNFTKMHSLGNDFIVIDDRKNSLRNTRHLAVKLCHRRFGIGADQMLILRNSREGDFYMGILNSDGSEVEMCGNGIRCLGKYIWDTVLKNVRKRPDRLTIETLAGIKVLERSGRLIKVDMGEPVFEPERIPVKVSGLSRGRNYRKGPSAHLSGTEVLTGAAGCVLNYPLKVKDRTFRITCVSMGNPHAVTVVKDVDSFPLHEYGPLMENHASFPKRINAEFIQVLDRGNIRMRVWERGAGETMACGTGASASAVASALLQLTDRKVTVHLPGGKLKIDWSVRDDHVYMTGDAVKVFEGTAEV